MDSPLTTEAARGQAPIAHVRDAGGDPAAPGRKNRRAYLLRVVVLKDLQLKLMLHHAFAFLLAMSGVAAMLFGPLLVALGSGDTGREAEAADQMLALHVSFWPAAAVGLAFVMLFSLFLSHRIAGPLYRLRKTMAVIGAGEIPRPISLRTNDFLQDDAAAFNEMLAGLRSRVQTIGEEQRALSELVRELEAADPGDPDALRVRMGELVRTSRSLEDAIESIRVEGSGETLRTADDREG